MRLLRLLRANIWFYSDLSNNLLNHNYTNRSLIIIHDHNYQDLVASESPTGTVEKWTNYSSPP